MLIAIEGIDGSGKATQTALLAERASQSGLKTATFSFPRYGSNVFSVAIGKYLNGDMGDINAMPPYLIALMFAGDRFMARDEIVRNINSCDLVISDRYVASNLAHQGAKLPPEQRGEFFTWACNLEFGTYGLPRPHLSIYLDMPVKTARRMIPLKNQRSYTSLPEDLHEKDEPYLVRCAHVYRDLIEHDVVGPWAVVPCADAAGDPLPASEVTRAVWEAYASRRRLVLPAG